MLAVSIGVNDMFVSSIMPTTEIDNHVDTICAGKNSCCIESYTSEVCSVSPFLDEYSDQEEIHICTALTATALPHIGLQMGQFLDFLHTKMSKTLINPNQLSVVSVPVCDNPMEKNHLH